MRAANPDVIFAELLSAVGREASGPCGAYREEEHDARTERARVCVCVCDTQVFGLALPLDHTWD